MAMLATEQLSRLLDFKGSLERPLVSNDLLPPREDDTVSGELGKRFTAHLQAQLASGAYVPQPAEFVSVPKPGFTSRPAALLTLRDRVVYHALVVALRQPLSKYLVPASITFWPREEPTKKQWQAFEYAPLGSGASHIVQADVSGYYDSIDHQLLTDELLYATGEGEIVAGLLEFLNKVMSGKRGVPQGLVPSDALATTFLQPLDAAIVRAGISYWRHGDDIRIAAGTFSEAREAIALLEHELRRRGLLLNSAKCAIVTAGDYASSLEAAKRAQEETKDLITRTRIDFLKGDADALSQMMDKAQLDEEVGWAHFYHGSISFAEVIEMIRPHLEPNATEVAETIFRRTMERAPDRDHSLPKEQFHQQFVFSLARLTAGRSPTAIAEAASIVARFADKTEHVCGYLSALGKSHPKEVVAQIENLLDSSVYTTDWQKSWLLRTLAAVMAHARAETVALVRQIASSEARQWIARVEAMKALAGVDQLDQSLMSTAWRIAPDVYKPDLLAAACRAPADWAKRFVSVAHHDPVLKVIISHMQNQSAIEAMTTPAPDVERAAGEGLIRRIAGTPVPERGTLVGRTDEF